MEEEVSPELTLGSGPSYREARWAPALFLNFLGRDPFGVTKAKLQEQAK